MNRGTKEGDIQEIDFVKAFNTNKKKFNEYLSNFNNKISDIWMCRVTTQQYSQLSECKVYTRADAYLIECKNPNINSILKKNNYFLSEDILAIENINYNFIPLSGVSVKMTDSTKFQILKLQPDSFNKLFNNYELGAGASIYCKKEEELIKNKSVLEGWKTNNKKMINFFSTLNLTNNFDTNIEECKKIKTFSNDKIKEIIDKSKELQKKIFNGYKLYGEPYTAWYLNHGDTLVRLSYIPFNVTTGSGRSHGDYTIVLKPTNL